MRLNSKKNCRLELGIIICLFGTQLSRLVMELTGTTFNTTNLVFVVGLLLLVPLGRKSKSILVFDKKIFAILMYQFLVLLYAFYSEAALFNLLTGTAYTWFCVAFLILINWNRQDLFKGDAFVCLGWWILGIGSVILCWVATKGLRQFVPIIRLPNGSDRLTLSVIAFGFLTFFLCYNTKSVYEKIIGCGFLVFSVIDIYLCTRKGMLISFVGVLGIHFYRAKKKINIKRCLKIIGVFLFIIIIETYVLNKIPAVSEAISRFWILLKNSVLGYLGKVGGMYNTGAERNANMRDMIGEMQNNFSAIDVIFGKGYAYKNIDFPYLEAFSDFGIIGGIFFLWVAFFIPIKMIFQKDLNPAIRFAQYYTLMTIAQNIYSGLPFGHYKFVPIIFLAWLMTTKGKL